MTKDQWEALKPFEQALLEELRKLRVVIEDAVKAVD